MTSHVVVRDFGLAPDHAAATRNVKRSIDDFDSDGLVTDDPRPVTKKTARLPIRTSPKRPKRPTLGPRKTAFISLGNQTPPSPESSEDELDGGEDTEMDLVQSASPSDHDYYLNHAVSPLSILTQLGEEDQMELAVSPIASRNDTLSSPQPTFSHNRNHTPHVEDSGARPAMTPMSSDRVSTPVYSAFPRNPQDRLPLIETQLSPAIGGVTPTTSTTTPTPTRLPSPSPLRDCQMDTMSPGLSGGPPRVQRVHTALNMSPPAPAARSLSSVVSASGRGSPRVHMGWRADCEKCRQRVPGHYNHVLWE